ncbi:2-oxo-tetronate isomerase [Citrobacter tructae]|uniref:2-oxo-tetronate isomerase n=1 Tax=Citrobacter tructae TaxID=2562449 RepID=UPI003F55C505
MQISKNKTIELKETETVEQLTNRLGRWLVNHHMRLTTAESCTGGKLASALCAADDTPEFYGVGFVTFTDEAKQRILGVEKSTLEKYTAVSEAVVHEMANGALKNADVDISVAISGYGGPEGGEDGTPAGTVWFAWNIRGSVSTSVQHFDGDCDAVLSQSVRFALAQLLSLLDD